MSRLAPSHPQRPLFRGCLLAGAVGDALGAGIEFLSLSSICSHYGPHGITGYVEAWGGRGRITDDTQMTLFTAEGLIRASVSRSSRGIGDPASVVHHAYRRWLHTQGVPWKRAAGSLWSAEHAQPDGWLVSERWLHARRAPGNTCVSALSARCELGTPAQNDSKGCGGVMRAAPAGLMSDGGPKWGGAPEEGF
jgi:ADP-ribosylglycohydrolase